MKKKWISIIVFLTDSHLFIRLRYRTDLILEKLITNEHGCRIYHGNHEQFIQEFQQRELQDTVSITCYVF